MVLSHSLSFVDTRSFSRESGMNYQDKLTPWKIVRLQSNLQHIIVGRFRRRGDAEGHLRILQRMMPELQFVIVFDVGAQEELMLSVATTQEDAVTETDN